ncbi:MAG: bifunctional ornithine acetyltransferase/N-acetylglutamate synthase, partial [Chloroflexi bacterium]|nr:bifunctional ornithine acetyltransferase/N-acetylglutamate synthase [Chloroflexota bacterium]
MSGAHNALGANPAAEGAITRPRGFSACGFTAGIKESGLPDLALLVSDRPATAAAVYTQNQSTAAPVHISKAHTKNASLRAAVVNSGNANCATGDQGLADAREMTRLAASLIGCDAEEVFVNSTGIIGHYLPMDLLRVAIPQLAPTSDGGADFTRAIMTTDTFQKEAVATFK